VTFGPAAAILYSYRQARGDDGGALRPRQTVQQPPSAVAHAVLLDDTVEPIDRRVQQLGVGPMVGT